MAHSLRIAFITNNYTPYGGGVVQSIDAITQELRSRGHDVRIITLDFPDTAQKDPPWVLRLQCPIKFKTKTKYAALPWCPAAQLRTIFKQFPPDIVHVHHPFLLGPAATKVAREASTPVIFTYHTMYEHYAHHIPFPASLTQTIIKRMAHHFCTQVAAIIAPSNTIATTLKSDTIETPIIVIPSPLRTPFLTNTPNKEQKNGPLRLLHVGRFAPEKNIPFLLEVASILREKDRIVFDLVGYGPDYESTKKQAYEILKFSPKMVRFTHRPPLKTLLRFYREADLFLFPSTTDTQGIVLAEAMASGTPVIAPHGPGQDDIIVDGHNGAFAETPQDMAIKILTLHKNKLLLAALSAAALRTAQRYHPTEIGTQLLQLYRTFMP